MAPLRLLAEQWWRRRALAAALRELQERASERRATRARADFQLGELLSKRRIKPGAVVTSWAKSRGAHQGELSKKEFREAVLELGEPALAVGVCERARATAGVARASEPPGVELAVMGESWGVMGESWRGAHG